MLAKNEAAPCLKECSGAMFKRWGGREPPLLRIPSQKCIRNGATGLACSRAVDRFRPPLPRIQLSKCHFGDPRNKHAHDLLENVAGVFWSFV
jgi:hypothetical protein